MAFEGLDEKNAREILKKVDKQRNQYVKDLSRKLNIKGNQEEFDLEINTDRLDVKDASSIILHGFSLYYYGLKKAYRQRPARRPV